MKPQLLKKLIDTLISTILKMNEDDSPTDIVERIEAITYLIETIEKIQNLDFT